MGHLGHGSFTSPSLRGVTLGLFLQGTLPRAHHLIGSPGRGGAGTVPVLYIMRGVCCWWVSMVVRFVCVVCVPLCVRVFRVSRVCPGSPRCLFTGNVPVLVLYRHGARRTCERASRGERARARARRASERACERPPCARSISPLVHFPEISHSEASSCTWQHPTAS